MTIVIYSSHTGSSKKYAESFAEKMGFECHSVSEKIESIEPIIFFGWLKGPRIVGLDSADPFKLRAVVAVALEENPEFGWSKVKEVNNIRVPFYHVRGWIDRKKLNPLEKLFFLFLCVKMKLKGLDSHTQPLFDAMMNGGSFYDEAPLDRLEVMFKTK